MGSGWKAQTIDESEMALFHECMRRCGYIVLDFADIARDGDASPRESLASAKSAAFIDLLFASRLRYSIQ
jgi:hypothetical protein